MDAVGQQADILEDAWKFSRRQRRGYEDVRISSTSWHGYDDAFRQGNIRMLFAVLQAFDGMRQNPTFNA